MALHAITLPVVVGDVNRLEAIQTASNAVTGHISNLTERGLLANTVLLQSTIVLIIALEMQGPPSSLPPNARIPTRGQLFGVAVEIANHLKLRNLRAETFGSPAEVSAYKNARRAWWALSILDNFNAIGNASSTMITGIPSVHATMGMIDRQILGEQFYGLSRKLAVSRMP